MRTTVKVFACVLALTLPAAIALADDVAAPAATTTPAAPAAAVPAESSAASAPAAAPAPAAAAAPADGGAPAATGSEPIKLGIAVPPPPAFNPPPGYRPVKKGLETIYCKSYTPVGSRLPQQICHSKDQLIAIERQAELDRQLMHQKATNGGTSGN